MSLEVTIMTLRTLFEKQVFVRLTEDHTGLHLHHEMAIILENQTSQC